MLLKKENEYKNDNLKKQRELLNLSKDTKDTKTTDDKIMQHSKEKLDYQSESNTKIVDKHRIYNTSGNTAKLLNTEQAKTTNQILETGKQLAKDSVKNTVTKYRNELSKNDDGVATADIYIKTTTEIRKQTKNTVNKLQNIKLKKQTKQQLKSNKTLLQNQIDHNKTEIKEIKKNINEKLKKNNKQLEQAKKELKQKKSSVKENKADLKLVKKEQAQHNFIRKVSKQPVTLSSAAVKKGLTNYKKQLENGDQGTETVAKTSSLVKQGTKAIAKAKKIRRKQLNQEKLRNISTKLSESSKTTAALKKAHNNNLQKINKQKLKKKIIKKRMYAPHYQKRKTLSAITTTVKTGVKKIYTSVKRKAPLIGLKSIIDKKIALGGGTFLINLLPIFIVFIVSIGVIFALFSGGGGYEEELSRARNFPPEVEQWRELVTLEAQAQGMGNYVDLILAIITVESGGTGTKDIMQSSESAGLPPNTFRTEEESVRQGINYLKNIINVLKSYNRGLENNFKLIAQSYNFGSPFAHHIGDKNLDYSLDVAEAYSRDILAPANGNPTSKTVPYNNPVAEVLGKPYRYLNGGNFLYGELVGQYLTKIPTDFEGDFGVVMSEILKYEGTPYVWGGKTPQTGFDCSGLVEWGLKQIGINLPSPATSQYYNTYPIDPSEAKPGDLIFFKGTYGGANHISHVGFYIDETTMYDANGSGVGYTNWQTPYWQKHFAEIRRIK